MIQIWGLGGAGGVLMKGDKAALDCCRQLLVCIYARVGMATWSGTGQAAGPPLKAPPPHPPRCAALFSGLIVGGQEGGITPGMIPCR